MIENIAYIVFSEKYSADGLLSHQINLLSHDLQNLSKTICQLNRKYIFYNRLFFILMLKITYLFLS
jgi:hypothetical protein